MGTKVQFENHLRGLCSMRGLNHESDGTHWPLFYGENNLPNRQYCYSLLPRPPVDSSPGADKDTLKHTILKQEAIFKDQVIELHRLYRVQKDLMYTIEKKEQYTHRTTYEASSSSSVFPLQTAPEDAHRRSSSNFLFANSVCEGPLIQSPGSSPLKGKGIHASSIPLHGSPRGSEVSESRPKKLRKVIDLELPAEENVDLDEVEQLSNGENLNFRETLFPSHLRKSECENGVFGSDSCSRKPCALADLNEPALPEETNVNPSVDISSSQCNDNGNAHQWFPSMIKEAGIKDDVRSIDQINHLGKASVYPSPVQNAHQQAYSFPRPHPVKEDMWSAKANVGFKTSDRSQKMFLVQSSVHSNEFPGNRCHMINQDQFYSAGGSLSKGLNSIDLNTALPNGLPEEQLAKECVVSVDCEVQREDRLSAFPWLRPKGGVSSKLSRQNSIVASSCDVDAARAKDRSISDHPSFSRKIQNPPFGEDEIESGRRKPLLDINVACDDPEAFDSAVASEIIAQEEKTEPTHSSSIRTMFDLNSCATEDESHEIPSRTIIIDLEAPVNLENEEDEPLQGTIDSSGDEEIARAAAEAIVSISMCAVTVGPDSIEEASVSEDALQWFVDIVCSAPEGDEDGSSCESDYLEEMTLKLTECTVDEYFPSPPVFDIPAPEEPGPSSGRIRRGPMRRGRQRRDFQRDILPGLTSLARNEVTEDLQTFGGLMRATGHTWHCQNTSRKGARRGRRRKTDAIPPPVPPPVEITLEDRSLSSWGKTTRRPRRQRCPSATPGNLTYFALA